MIDAEVVLSSPHRVHAQGGPAEVEFEVMEVAGPSSLPASAASLSDVLDFSLYQGVPVVDLALNWAGGLDLEVSRPGERYAAGRTDDVEIKGARGRVVHGYPVTALSRSEAFRALRLFDYLRGRVGVAWVIPASGTLRLVSYSLPDTVRVEKDAPLSWMESHVEYLGIVLDSGARLIAPVTDILDGGSTWDIKIALGSYPATVIARVEPASIARLDHDALTEEWSTDETCEMEMRFIDLLNEGDAEVTDVGA